MITHFSLNRFSAFQQITQHMVLTVKFSVASLRLHTKCASRTVRYYWNNHWSLLPENTHAILSLNRELVEGNLYCIAVMTRVIVRSAVAGAVVASRGEAATDGRPAWHGVCRIGKSLSHGLWRWFFDFSPKFHRSCPLQNVCFDFSPQNWRICRPR